MLMKKYWVVLKAAVSERGTFRGRGFFCGYGGWLRARWIGGGGGDGFAHAGLVAAGGGNGFAHAGLCPQACAGVPASECWKL